MTKVITIGCFKGGVGKSSLTEILTYLLAKEGYKVLAVDTDPQS
ncbi:ParA family protein, partial [Staphylococcus aureus]|nr:ParA family protein [Staphylococcus aureus]